MKTIPVLQTLMRAAAMPLGLVFPYTGHAAAKLGIFGIILLFSILDADNPNRIFRVSVVFIAGAIIGFAGQLL